MEQTIYIEKISFDKTDFVNENLKTYYIFKAFTHMATKHAEILGVGFEQMIKKNLLWVTMRTKYEIVGNIAPCQTYEITTFPQSKNMLEFDRDFLLKDLSGNILLRGTSKWCVIDSKTRRIARTSAIELPCADIKPVFDEKFLKTEAFVPQTAPDFSYQVVSDDIDSNGHMNNSIYARIVFDALRLGKNKEIKTFQLNFLHEAMLSNRIDLYTKQTQEGICVVGKLCEAENCFTALVKFKD